MLTIVVPGDEAWDEQNNEFITVGDVELQLEHSLVSLSKWEEIFEKPFLSKDEKTVEEIIAYIEAMNLSPEIPPEVFRRITQKNLDAVGEYIGSKRTATWFNDPPNQKPSREIITSELIYYWMIAFNIPIECETWFLGRLFTLIKVCSVKNQNTKPSKPTRDDLEARRRLNAERRAALGTKG